MNTLSKVGLGCGCAPSLLLLLAGVVSFILLGAGFFNSSLEGTVGGVGGGAVFLSLIFGILGLVLFLVGRSQAKKAG